MGEDDEDDDPQFDAPGYGDGYGDGDGATGRRVGQPLAGPLGGRRHYPLDPLGSPPRVAAAAKTALVAGAFGNPARIPSPLRRQMIMKHA